MIPKSPSDRIWQHEAREPVRRGGYFLVPVMSNGVLVASLLDEEDVALLGDRLLSLGSHGYVQMFADRRVHLLHRWLFGLTGNGFECIVDHRNRDKLDNRRANLRIVDGSRSNANRPQADEPYVGVYQLRSGRYQAKFMWRGKRHHVGVFHDRDAAAEGLLRYRLDHCPDSLSPNGVS